MDPFPKVQLGDREYELKAQKIGRIRRKLSAVWELFSGTAAGEMPAEVGPAFYDALAVFIPDLEPYWKLAGYPNEAEYGRRKAHDEEVAEARERFAMEYRSEEGEPVQSFAELPEPVQQEFEADEFEEPAYDPDADHSPTPPQLIEVCETIYRIHGGERLQRLFFGLVKPESIRGYIDSWIESQSVSTLVKTRQKLGGGDSPQSPSSLRTSGASDPTNSGTTPPTSTPSAASLQPD